MRHRRFRSGSSRPQFHGKHRKNCLFRTFFALLIIVAGLLVFIPSSILRFAHQSSSEKLAATTQRQNVQTRSAAEREPVTNDSTLAKLPASAAAPVLPQTWKSSFQNDASPPPARQFKRDPDPSKQKYLIMAQSGGFTHNQLTTFSSAFRLSRAWDRVLVLPPPEQQAHWMGWFPHDSEISPWNMEELRSQFDFTDEATLANESGGDIKNHKVLGKYLSTPPSERELQGCTIGYIRLHCADNPWLQNQNKKCQVLLLQAVSQMDTSMLGVSYYDFYRHLKFNDLISKEIDRFFASREWKEPMISVHHRTWNENNHKEYDMQYKHAFEGNLSAMRTLSLSLFLLRLFLLLFFSSCFLILFFFSLGPRLTSLNVYLPGQYTI